LAKFKLVRRVGGLLFLGAVLGGAWFVQSVRNGIAPMPASDTPKYVRFDRSIPMTDALADLQTKGIVRDAHAMHYYALYRRERNNVPEGTYSLHPGMTADEIFGALKKAIRQMVRVPEENWSNRTARLLEKKEVLKAADYEALVKTPQEFKNDVDFPLPPNTLEGYLWPDTYDFPPEVGARTVISRQLKAFEKKVWIPLGKPANLDRTLIIASMIELEVARDEERPIVAGIIENRLKKKMPLQLDATILFAQDNWHEPNLKDIRKTDSPFNTYKHKGLPPTPVCSPGLKSIEAAMHPSKNDYLYYVALPGGKSLFAKTMKEHEANIGIRKAELALIKVKGGL
jgi:UPF0755 protein